MLEQEEASLPSPKRSNKKWAQFWDQHFQPTTQNEEDGTEASDEEAAPNQTDEDWIASFEDIEEILNQQLSFDKTQKFLVVGCGSSPLGSQLYDRGYHNVTSTDISGVVIESMEKQNQQLRPEMRWIVNDITDTQSCNKMLEELDFRHFDVVIDKGVSDTLQYRRKHTERLILLQRMFTQVQRLLSPEGVFVIVSPRRRIRCLDSYPWKHIGRFQVRNPPSLWLDHNSSIKKKKQQKRRDIFVFICRMINAQPPPPPGKNTHSSLILSDHVIEFCQKIRSFSYSIDDIQFPLHLHDNLQVVRWDRPFREFFFTFENVPKGDILTDQLFVVTGKISAKRLAARRLVFYDLIKENVDFTEGKEDVDKPLQICSERNNWFDRKEFETTNKSVRGGHSVTIIGFGGKTYNGHPALYALSILKNHSVPI
eukprot:TRINITY_DN1893_c0_g1_i1.p1 TRINITY_DN1893_c0_g1~~TRINITY_DN1893_c0_g1_i1.p1  ORF type:complete len:424 (-),score=91.48 TRINITY_DN1893_c0_g1_i1:210-1481(-)